MCHEKRKKTEITNKILTWPVLNLYKYVNLSISRVSYNIPNFYMTGIVCVLRDSAMSITSRGRLVVEAIFT